jgi:hypothetical protein
MYASLRDRLLKWLRRYAESGRLEKLLTNVGRPFSRLFAYWFIWAVVADRLPKRWLDRMPELARQMEALRQAQNTRVPVAAVSDRDRALGQAMTWGVAGVGAVALIQIVTANISRPDDSPGAALVLATGCFAFAVPVLIICGFIHMLAHEPKAQRPSVRQILALHGWTHLSQFIVGVGFAALLWNYSAIVSVVFMLACLRAWRQLRRYVDGLAPAAVEAALTQEPQAPSRPDDETKPTGRQDDETKPTV